MVLLINKSKETPYLTTFKVCDKVPEKIESTAPKQNPVESLAAYKKNNCLRILQGTDFDSFGKIIPQKNGFVHTVIECYNTHHNLVIRPDDIWITLMTQLSFYINKNAEMLRSKFVNFEGQKELTVVVDGFLNSAPYDLCVKLMSEEIDKNLIDDEVKAWILPNFSTTTENDVITSGVVFMAAMKKYFTYKFCLKCGIPNITLDGTVEDWKAIVLRIKKLKDYDLGDWFKLLKPILKQFVGAKSGKVDKNFWNRICSHEGGGSGPRYLSGWLTVFCRFDEEGNVIGYSKIKQNPRSLFKTSANGSWSYVDMEDIPNGWVMVDVTIDDNGVERKSIMFAGHMASAIVGDNGDTLKPVPGWAIALTDPQAKNQPENDESDFY